MTTKTLSPKTANALRLLYQERDLAKRYWEAAKRSGVRGSSQPYYEDLKAIESKIDSITRGSRS